MKAIAYTSRGLQLQEVPRPTPKSHEVLIRIHATIAAAADFKLHSSKTPTEFSLFGPKQPKPIFPGQDLAGEIEAIGRKVTRFRKGDQVIGWSGIRLGTYAEYTCLPERGVLFIKPANMTYEESATLPVAGLDTANLLRRANIRPGEQVLINGAGGNMGTYAVQIARHLGAEVTGVDSTAKLNMLRSIGADHVIDYTQEDFNQSGKTYDVIFDVIGNRSISIIMERLNPNGRYLTAVPLMSQIIRWQLSGRRSGKKIIFWAPRTLGSYTVDFAFLKGLIEGGSVRAIIDRCFPLEQTAEATRYVESGHKLGHVVITVAQDPTQARKLLSHFDESNRRGWVPTPRWRNISQRTNSSSMGKGWLYIILNYFGLQAHHNLNYLSTVRVDVVGTLILPSSGLNATLSGDQLPKPTVARVVVQSLRPPTSTCHQR